VGVGDRTDGDAAQLLDGVADALEHLADLAGAALAELDGVPPAVLAAALAGAPCWRRDQDGHARRLSQRRDAAGSGAACPSSTMPLAQAIESASSTGRPRTLTS
jgi:hypothetical protein